MFSLSYSLFALSLTFFMVSFFDLLPTFKEVVKSDVKLHKNTQAIDYESTIFREKIKNIVIIMQENRSFDSYFGTFPGADGIPMKDGIPTVCNRHPATGECIKPFHSLSDIDYGGPHDAASSEVAVNDGKMNGFVKNAVHARRLYPETVMGYHNRQEIPNYWNYALNFVLQDRMFESIASWSLPSHVFMVSAWSARCKKINLPLSCESEIGVPYNYAWTDITYLLHKSGISWKYYINGVPKEVITQKQKLLQLPTCGEDVDDCASPRLTPSTPSIWNPLPHFDTVIKSNQLKNIQDISQFYFDVKNASLPSVSWIIPSGSYSEHPLASVGAGHSYVTGLVNEIMRSSQWKNVAIFISWDDWGGFYDHVPPPKIDKLGYGIRVPGLLISPYAKKGYIDHQTLSFDAYLKFIEDVFLNGQRLDPKTDGRPDSRPSVRENEKLLGNLLEEFDFKQPPRPPLILAPHLDTQRSR